MKINKQRILDIFLTALVSSLLAFLQSIVANMAGMNEIAVNPITAGAIGAGIKSFRA
jgi:hypothetical protein